MPNRMISGDLARSRSLSNVSIEAELTFIHLISVADDHGRFDGRMTVLVSALYPTRPEVIKKLDGWLNELEREGLLVRYEVGGYPYLYLPTWNKYQRLRASRDKFPAPPQSAASCGELPRVAAKNCGEARSVSVSEKREEKREAEGEESSPAGSPRVREVDFVREIWPEIQEAFEAYGKPSPKLTAGRLKTAAARLAEYPEAVCTVLIDAIHGRMRIHQKANGYDPLEHLTCESVWRPGTFWRDVEAAQAAMAAGEEPPYRTKGAK